MKIKKILNVIVGSIIMSIGIKFTILLNLGSDPMTMLWIGISNLLSITVGQANILVSFIFLVIVLVLDKKQLNIGSLLNPIVITMTLDMLQKVSIPAFNIWFRMILVIIGFLVLSFGIAMYAAADFGKGAYEALVFALSNKVNFKVGTIRTVFDILFAFIGVMLGAKFNIGTIIAIIFIGSGIQFFLNIINKLESEKK